MKEQDENTRDLLRSIPSDLKLLLDKRIELIELQLTERFAHLAGKLLFKIIGAALIFLGLFLLALASGYLIGQLLDNTSAGFAIAALAIILIGGLIFKFHTQKMVRLVKNHIIRAALEDDTYKSLSANVFDSTNPAQESPSRKDSPAGPGQNNQENR
jgi:uncharacterized membrane protein YqjE